MRDTSKEKMYQELGSGSLRDRLWCRKLYLFYNEVSENENPKYLQLDSSQTFVLLDLKYTQHPPSKEKMKLFQKLFFFPSTTIEWNNLNLCLGKSLRFLKPTFLSSYDHLQTPFIIFITLNEFVFLQELNLA